MEEKRAAAERRIREIDEQLRDLDWRRQSIQVADEEHRLHDLQKSLTAEEGLLKGIEAQITGLEHQHRVWLAIDDWVSAAEKEAEAAATRFEVEAMGKQNPELEADLIRHQGVLKRLLQQAIVREEERLNASRQQERSIEAEREGIRGQRQVIAEQQGTTERRIGEISAEIRAIERKRTDLLPVLGAEGLDAPYDAFVRLDEVVTALNKRIDHLKEEVGESEKGLQAARTAIDQDRERFGQEKVAAQQLTKEIERYETVRQEVIVSMTAVGIHGAAERLFDESVLIELDLRRTESAKALEALAVEQNAEQRRRDWLRGDSAYINREMESLHRSLADHGVLTQPGTVWLKNQVEDEPKRQEIVSAYPLLPYSLVVDESDYRILMEDPGIVSHLFLESAVPMVCRHPNLLDPSRAERISWLLLDHKGSRAFVAADVAALLTEATTALERLAGRQRQAEMGLKAADRATVEFNRFLSAYQSGDLEVWRRELEQRCKQAAELKQRLAEHQERIDGVTLAIKRARDESERLKTDLVNCQAQIARIQEWIPLFDQEPGLRREQLELHETIRRLADTVRQIDARDRHLEENLKVRRGTTIRLEQACEALRSEVEALRDTVAAEETDGELEFVRAECVRLRDLLRSRQGNIERLKEQASRLEVEAARLRDKVRKHHKVDIQLVDAQHRRSQEEFDQLEAMVAQHKTQKQLQERVTADLRSRVNRLEGGIERARQQIRDSFGREPWPVEGDLFVHRQQVNQQAQHCREERRGAERDLRGHEQALQSIRQAYDRLQVLAAVHPAAGRRPVDFDAVRRRLETYVEELSSRMDQARNRREEALKHFGLARQMFEDLLGSYDFNVRLLHQLLDHQNALSQQTLEQIVSMRNTVREHARSIEEEMKIHETVLSHVVEECVLRAAKIRAAAKSLPRYSLVRLPGEDRRRRLMEIEYPEPVPDEHEEMRQYLVRTVGNLKELPRDRWMETLRNTLEPAHLMDVIVDLSRASVRVAKVVVGGTAALDSWEKLIKSTDAGGWSEGEKYLGVLTVYLCLQSFIRSRLSGSDRSPKVLIADNPFARMNAQHLLQPIRQLLEATHTQWICATAHRDHNIFDLFPVHYSIKPISVGGVLWSKAERHLNTAQFVFLQDPDPLHGPVARFV